MKNLGRFGAATLYGMASSIPMLGEALSLTDAPDILNQLGADLQLTPDEITRIISVGSGGGPLRLSGGWGDMSLSFGVELVQPI